MRRKELFGEPYFVTLLLTWKGTNGEAISIRDILNYVTSEIEKNRYEAVREFAEKVISRADDSHDLEYECCSCVESAMEATLKENENSL